MKRLLALGFALLSAPLAYGNQPYPLPAYTERTGSKVLFHFDSVPVDVNVKSVKICTNRSPLKSLVLWSCDHGTTQTKIGKHESHCTEVRDLNFVAAGDWNLIATLENGEKAILVIHVRDENGL